MSNDNPVKIGGIAESAVAFFLKQAGFSVFSPVFDNSTRTDLLVYLSSDNIKRIQCKNGRLEENKKVLFDACSMDWTFHPGNTVTYSRKAYTGEIDYFGVYCEATGKCYLVPCDSVGISEVSMRIIPPEGNHKYAYRWAPDYEIVKGKTFDDYDLLTNKILPSCKICGKRVPIGRRAFCGNPCTSDSGRVSVKRVPRPDRFCAICTKKLKSGQRQYCGLVCYASVNQRCPRPPKEQFEIEISTMSWTAIGKKYGVTDNAIRKWAKSYGIKTERRPYVRADAVSIVRSVDVEPELIMTYDGSLWRRGT